MFKMKKLAAVAAAAAMAVSAMAISVSAAISGNNGSVSTQSTQSNWSITSEYITGTVTGLVQGTDTGVTFRCTAYYNPTTSDYDARCTVTNANLCKYQGEGVNLSYVGDDGIVLFKDEWYSYSSGGRAPYKVQARNTVENSGQYIRGYAR